MVLTKEAQSEKDEAFDLICYAEDIAHNTGMSIIDVLKEFASSENSLISNAQSLLEEGAQRSVAFADILPEDIKTALYWAEGNQVPTYNIFAEIHEISHLLSPIESHMKKAGRIPDTLLTYIATVRHFFLMKAMVDLRISVDTVITAVAQMGDNTRRRRLCVGGMEGMLDKVFTGILSSAEMAVLKTTIKYRVERKYLADIANSLKGRISQQAELLYNAA
jgi:hypothetical protein